MWKLYEIKIAVSITKVLLEPKTTFVCLHIVYGNVHGTTAKLSRSSRSQTLNTQDILSGPELKTLINPSCRPEAKGVKDTESEQMHLRIHACHLRLPSTRWGMFCNIPISQTRKLSYNELSEKHHNQGFRMVVQ